MTPFVVDASVAIKWVVNEAGTDKALALRRNSRLMAPELMLAECANILWKKVRRSELSALEGRFAAMLIESTGIEFVEMRSLITEAAELAFALDHPAYDCMYLALARQEECQFVTADERLVRKLRQTTATDLRNIAILLDDCV
ncbi:type II toxin-antitoxin system VapC family toxin [Neorhizobium sp. JUb45]|uniref:type II toxin-antitoxin system VapC family toxin n=1 Tax=Neorhizobium sp. JUb45 TaxID=2485113 RepID=UPI00105047C4|nr:type II toxin-antitoxin system VapC family toxin [Neorhizobium sp. JUb45]TCR04351.1 putative nucleic acid-binding protein [Neorhizobium sp. JUb45]